VSRRLQLTIAVIGVLGFLIGAATLWQRAETDPRYARVLLLDPRTGETLHEQVLDGGYAVAALLSGGRVAVGTLDSCPDQRGGTILVLAATLERVISSRAVNPCVVARLDTRTLRLRFESDAGMHFIDNAPDHYTVRLGSGRIVQTYDGVDGGNWLARMTAYDANGKQLWKRNSLGRIGAVDVRDGRVVVPVFGEFTPGSD
jgi:hypothetical protein